MKTLDELINKIYGEIGTPKRDQFEKKLKKDLIIQQKKKKKNLSKLFKKLFNEKNS